MRCCGNKAEECTLTPGCSGHGRDAIGTWTASARDAVALAIIVSTIDRSSSAAMLSSGRVRSGGDKATRRAGMRSARAWATARQLGTGRAGCRGGGIGTPRVRLIGRARHGHRRRRELARTIGATVKRGVPLVGALVDASASGDSAKRGAAKRAACDGAQRRAEAGDAVRRTASRHRGRMHFGKGERRVRLWRARRAGCTSAGGEGKHSRCSERGRRRREARRRGPSSAHSGWRWAV